MGMIVRKLSLLTSCTIKSQWKLPSEAFSRKEKIQGALKFDKYETLPAHGILLVPKNS